MSGIAGLFSLDGEPIDQHLLRRLTRTMHYRGPDALETWYHGRIGFGHTLLRTGSTSRQAQQPCSVDNQVWILADARVDGRSELCQQLRRAGRDCLQSASDAELILHAYQAWGEDCVRHLLGDFAFAIWDAPRELLFCARDQFGVKPFFYAHVGNCVVFSNTLNCVREHPAVDTELNDLAIADFLISGINQDQASTAFVGIHRLAPAHRLNCSRHGLRVDRYWNLPTDDKLRYPKASEYIEHFTEHLNTAVADRMDGDRIGILMSGGLDSTSIAATAKAILSEQSPKYDLRAYACVYDRLFVDEERHFSGLAADSLGIPIHYLVADDYSLFERWHKPDLHLPEPANEPLAALYLDQARQMAANCRVALTGWDGDALLNESADGYGSIITRGIHFAGRTARLSWQALSQGCWPRLSLPGRLVRLISEPREAPFVCPRWLNPDLVEHLDLPARWRAQQANDPAHNCKRPQAYRALTSPLFTNLLESYDPGVTHVQVETRHPLLDLRVVKFLLSLPASPWRVDKKLLRLAMRDRLPEPVRLRPKSALAGDPEFELLQRPDARWVDNFEPNPVLDRYINTAMIPRLAGSGDPEQLWTDLRPLCLNFWLQQLSTPGPVTRREEYHEVA